MFFNISKNMLPNNGFWVAFLTGIIFYVLFYLFLSIGGDMYYLIIAIVILDAGYLIYRQKSNTPIESFSTEKNLKYKPSIVDSEGIFGRKNDD